MLWSAGARRGGAGVLRLCGVAEADEVVEVLVLLPWS